MAQMKPQCPVGDGELEPTVGAMAGANGEGVVIGSPAGAGVGSPLGPLVGAFVGGKDKGVTIGGAVEGAFVGGNDKGVTVGGADEKLTGPVTTMLNVPAS